jgi:transposase-like protein
MTTTWWLFGRLTWSVAPRQQKTMANCTTCSPEKRAKILAALTDGASISRAARAAGVPRSTLYLWRRTDKVFAEAMAEAIETGTDLLEDEALRRGLEYSDALLIFLLKARRPNKYVHRLATEGHRRVEGRVEFTWLPPGQPRDL